MTPAVVATALPPWKWLKIEKVWPKTANKPNKAGEIVAIPKSSGKTVANVPLSKSIAKTTVPAFLPKILKVLVVPMLPDPKSRKFLWKK